MTSRLLLDERYSAEIAEQLRADGHDVAAILESSELRAHSDAQLFRWAAGERRRIVTENIKDFRLLLLSANTTGERIAPLLLVSPRRFTRGAGDRAQVVVKALSRWLRQRNADHRPNKIGCPRRLSDPCPRLFRGR